MRRRWRLTVVVVISTVLVLAIAGAVLAQGPWWKTAEASSPVTAATTTVTQPAAETGTSHPEASATSAASLSEAEKAALMFLREEEKLARDVYLALSATWGTSIFSNIAGSETRHMESVKTLLDSYGLTDPIGSNAPGVFTDPELQTAYNDLVAKGSASLEEAFAVGVTIEDLDIEDLESLLSMTSRSDITEVAQNLLRGSQNHLRAFTRQAAR